MAMASWVMFRQVYLKEFPLSKFRGSAVWGGLVKYCEFAYR